NGASVNLDRIAAWTNDYSYENTDNPQQPTSEQYLSDLFALIKITLPADVSAQGELKFHWQAGPEAAPHTDDVIIGNIELLQGMPQQTNAMMAFSADDLLVEDDDAQALEFEHDAVALAGLSGILGEPEGMQAQEMKFQVAESILMDL